MTAAAVKLSTEGLGKVFASGPHSERTSALEGVDFEISDGEFVSTADMGWFVVESGSGTRSEHHE